MMLKVCTDELKTTHKHFCQLTTIILQSTSSDVASHILTYTTRSSKMKFNCINLKTGVLCMYQL